jgi:hypothetical protein
VGGGGRRDKGEMGSRLECTLKTGLYNDISLLRDEIDF